MQGTVITTMGTIYRVRTDEGRYYECSLRGAYRLKGVKTTSPLTVGDRVDFQWDETLNAGAITAVGQRRNCIIRKSVNLSKQSHLLAANIDHAYLVAGLLRPFTPPGFIDRFLVTAEAYQIPATVLFNKMDLWDKPQHDTFERLRQQYLVAGYPCHAISVLTNSGIDDLKNELQGKISLIAGNSGVGKSALLNALNPNLKLRIGGISETHLKGKHTTTFAEMYDCGNAAFVIDTPGIKEFGMVDFRKEELALYFPEMKALVSQCRFTNCTHEHEPHCAVKQAVERGQLSAQRYQSYLNILHGEELDIEAWECK